MNLPRLARPILIMLAVLLAWSWPVSAQSQGWQAGAAALHISPRPQDLDGTLYLGGHGEGRERGPALGVHTPISARALALTDGTERLLFLTLDVAGFDQQLVSQIRAGAATATGWPQERIWVSATHTHSAPDLLGFWGGTPDGYRAYLIERAAEAARQAVDHLEPVELAVTTARGAGLGVNLRQWAFTDESLSLLVARRPGGPLVAVLVNAGIPPTVLGPQNRWISPDWVGAMRSALEEWHGGIALFINGVGGDVAPAAEAGGFHGATAYGLRVAKQVDAVLRSLDEGPGGDGTPPGWKVLAPQLRVSVDELALPVQNQRFLEALETNRLGYQVEQAAGQATVTTWVGRAVLGRDGTRAEMLTIPGEVVTRLGIQIRGLMQSPHAFILGFTHDTLGVFLSWDEWMSGRNGNGEEAHSLGVNAGVLLHQALSGLP